MSKFRKKPVEIEATQWFPGVDHPGVFGHGDPNYPPYVITIHEQRAYLSEGDWIIPEPKPCRYYPCKPDIFAATYDPVADHAKRELAAAIDVLEARARTTGEG